MEDSSVRVLVTAFACVPGTSPHAAAVLGMASALHADLDIVTLKTESLRHLERIGRARMFRVPAGSGGAAQRREAFGRAVARQLEAQPYDVVHVRGPVEGRIVAGRRRVLGFRFVYEIATFPDEAEGHEAESAWNDAHAECMEEAGLILVPTAAAARAVGEQGHAGKVAIVPPGVDVDRFDWWPGGGSEARGRLLYLGSFGADRDLGTVLGAVRSLGRDLDLEVLIAGDTDFERRERLRTVVQSFGLTECVTVRGEPDANAIPLIIGAADVCLAPASASPRFQDHGDLPQPILEYLACRRPVIAAAVPGLSDVLRDDLEGLVYPPGDEATLAESVAALLGAADQRERLVEAAYERVRSRFSDGARRRRIAEVYEMLVSGSQQFDPWTAGFSYGLTGEVEVPTGLLKLEREQDDERGTETLRRLSRPGEEAPCPGPLEPLDRHATPAYERKTGEDTHPGTDPDARKTGEDTHPGTDPSGPAPGDLPSSQTVLTAPPDGMDAEGTHETESPPGVDDVDTGELRSPDKDARRGPDANGDR